MSETPHRLEFKRLSRRFKTPLHTASGSHATRESLLLRATLPDGRAGFAEIAPWPGFPGPDLDTAERALRSSETPTTGAAAHAIAAALDWARHGWGQVTAEFPCAGLVREDADAAGLIAAGYTTLKRKIGVTKVRDEQRAMAALIRAGGPDITWRVDANGALTPADCDAWCDFLSEYPEVAWLEQPLRPGAEATIREIAERAGVAGRIALDESAVSADTLPAEWPGVLAVKPVLLGDLAGWRTIRATYPQVAYASAFESPFGRQAALCLAAEDSRAGRSPVGFGTLGAFADTLDRHQPGPCASTLDRDPAWWDALWATL